MLGNEKKQCTNATCNKWRQKQQLAANLQYDRRRLLPTTYSSMWILSPSRCRISDSVCNAEHASVNLLLSKRIQYNVKQCHTTDC